MRANLQGLQARVFVFLGRDNRLRTLIIFLTCLIATVLLRAQQPFSQAEALKQIYKQYDAEKETAQWVCTKEQEKNTMHEGWPCDKEYETVSVSVELTAEVQESGAKKYYLATSAKPIDPKAGDFTGAGYNCHACSVAIGAGVFIWKAQHWILESANAAIGFYGGWGSSPKIKLVQVGPEKHGLLLSIDDLAQGYAWSNKELLMPVNTTIAEVWRIEDEQDDDGAYDPTDEYSPKVKYRSSAAFRFYATHLDNGGLADYFDIEVISRGNSSSKDLIHLKPENWTEIYRFKDGKYSLLHHRDFIEIHKPQGKTHP
jgi:hypothetical protein